MDKTKHTDGGSPNQDVKAWRAVMGYSVAEACQLLEVTEDEFKSWEAGKRPPRYITLACAALALGIKS